MEQEFQVKWNKCLELIKDNIGEKRFNTWFACAKATSYIDNKLTLKLPSAFYCDKYEDDFIDILKLALRKEFGKDIKLGYEYNVLSGDDKSKVSIESPQKSHLNNKLVTSYSKTPIEKREIDFDPQLNYALNFENYCVGDSNILPHTIAKHIAENPGKPEFNPFFLYGNVGVGKTHLIQAIGIRIKEQNPNARVLFVPMKHFSQLYQQAYLNKNIPEFINWFQAMDVIMFDDLQELSHKTGTAEALFPIFNHLQRNNKNIIFTCDRPPMELDGLADRLIDRFKWGVVERLPNPDFQLRKMILESKSRRNGLELPQDVINIIATRIDGSVRELETVVNGLLTRSIVKNAPLSVELAEEVMSHVVKLPVKKAINFDMIVESTAEYFNLSPDAIFSPSRLRDIADARQMIMYLSHKHTSLSSPAIGSKLNRKHATVLHGISSIEDRLSYSKELSDALAAIEKDLLK
ncbi:MAG: chromosomal replication initiator protein DnaA [Bacteroides sp.]|nr:chromosomal replication initiator protein DnaA [Bacteroidales bacterium]MBD5304120.1 chromosomal replication initiator protein DnaA [Bacteroides sp.]MBD5340801.1 chromosomal replication initiator protein DnaA [Bacteroides sp.]MDE6083256.1 chromosomal replication initiator protein DnaA [Muribaculaceae bacterium]MDE6083259.1 chromosomal replication initiator protein DnaA [Muribaculaceae bacterium]